MFKVCGIIGISKIAFSNFSGSERVKITNTKLYVPIVTLSTKDNMKLTKQLNEGFKKPVYWNEYKKNRIKRSR